MAKEKEETVDTSAQVSAKKLRRGISNKTQAVNQLRFHEKDAAANGLFVGHLEEVRVDWSVNADGKSFTGLKCPRLTFHFASNHTNPVERRHVYHTLFPVESNVETIPGGKEEWKVNQLLNCIKHFLDVFYLKGKELSEAEEEALSLPFADFDDAGDYVYIEPEEVLKGYAYLFDNTVAILNGTFNLPEGETPKCCYKDANGKPISIWMKLLRHKKNKGSWINVAKNGDLAFDSFLGNGIIEIQKPNTPPSILRLDLSKESITPKETKIAPTLGGVGVPGMGMGNIIQDAGAASAPNINGAFADAGEEMPF